MELILVKLMNISLSENNGGICWKIKDVHVFLGKYHSTNSAHKAQTYWFEFSRPVRHLCPGVYNMKPHDGFVLLVPPLSGGNLQKFLWCVRGEQGPSLMALY